MAVMKMFDAFNQYRNRMERIGGTTQLANRNQSIDIMEFGFCDSRTYREVIIDGEKYDARVIPDSQTSIRGGNGNYKIQFRDGIYPPAGTYVQIPNARGDYEWWLIMYESDDHDFLKHLIKKCNYLLRWKNSKGEIIERWCVFSDNFRMQDGERKSNFNKQNMPYYNMVVALALDSETKNIRLDKRFLIDVPDLEEAPDAYIVTNRNIISKTFLNDTAGIIEFSVAAHQFNHNTDNKELMIADYYKDYNHIEDVNERAEYDCRIIYNGNSELRMNAPYKKYTVEVYLNGELQSDVPIDFDVVMNDDDVENFDYTINDNQLFIKCKQNDLLNGSFIRIIAFNSEIGCSAELPVKVVSLL